MSKAYQEAVLRGKERSFSQFLWDGEKKAFCGRNLTSWLKIIIFYNIYYGFLAAFFSICMTVFLMTIDLQIPKYTPGNQDSILRNPGLAFRPQTSGMFFSEIPNLIRYNADHGYEVNEIVWSLDSFTESYESDFNDPGIVNCDDRDTWEFYPDENFQSCIFDLKELGPCNKENGWGYRDRTPCVLIKMNKMIGWYPDVYEDRNDIPYGHIPEDLRINHMLTTEAETDDFDRNRQKPMVWLWCTQQTEDGQVLDGSSNISYFPQPGFPKHFFPYLNMQTYHQPLVALQFTNPPLNQRIDVECKAWAKNIVHYKKENLGMVSFSLLIETDD